MFLKFLFDKKKGIFFFFKSIKDEKGRKNFITEYGG
jgi:hypothetical protein